MLCARVTQCLPAVCIHYAIRKLTCGPVCFQEEEPTAENKLEPTHYSQLDPKNMNVNDLRNELKARSINSKGLKSQLVARLTKTLKAEAEKTEDDSVDISEQSDMKMETDEKEEKRKEVCLIQHKDMMYTRFPPVRYINVCEKQ